jgi:hypothetical protein
MGEAPAYKQLSLRARTKITFLAKQFFTGPILILVRTLTALRHTASIELRAARDFLSCQRLK